MGYGIAGVLGFNFNNHVGIQGEVIYNSLSQKYKDQNINRKINVKYVNIPLLLSLNTGKSKAININFVAGPQFGISLGSSINAENGNSLDTVSTVFAAKNNDFGLAYGAGLELMLNPARTLRLDLGYRGIYGLGNISKTGQNIPNNSRFILEKANVRTNSAYLGIALLF